VFQKTIKAGHIVEVLRYDRIPCRPSSRKPHTGETTATQRYVNERQARLHIARLLNANFASGDRFVTLTYASEPTLETAQKAVEAFIKRLQNCYPKLKYVAKTETKERIHHHFLLKSNVNYADLERFWNHGYVNSTPIHDDDMTALANYLTKEERQKGQKYIKRSRSLAAPKVTNKTIKRKHQPKGVVVSERFKDSVFYGRSTYQKLKV
jgi:hypothetical protein